MYSLNSYDNSYSELEAKGKKEESSDEESFHFFQEINKEQNNSTEISLLNKKREHSIDEDKDKENNNDIESSLELDKDEINHGKEEENNSEKDSHEVKKSKKKKKSKSKNNNNNFKSVKTKQVCQFYINGACKKGDKCPYSHDAEQIHKKELCKFFLSGKCLKGDKCLYSHDLSEIPCKFYHGLGFCENFQNCPFSHERLDMEGIKEFIKANEDFLRETKNKYGRTNMDEFYNEYLKEKEGGGDEFIMMPDFIKKEDEEKEKEKENNKDKIPLGILIMSNNNKIINEIQNFYNISNMQKLNNHNFFNLNQNANDKFRNKKANGQNIMFNNSSNNIGRINNNLNKYNQNNTKTNQNLNTNNYNNSKFNEDKEAIKECPNHKENKDGKSSIDINNLKLKENVKNEEIKINKSIKSEIKDDIKNKIEEKQNLTRIDINPFMNPMLISNNDINSLF